MTDKPPVSTRKIPRQATSSVAFVAEPPDEDDPLLQFAPYLHKRPRRNSITPELQRRFVATLAATGIVKQAARRIGKSLEALYKLRQQPGAEGFAAAWDAAVERGVTRLEDCALERAIQGTRTPIVSGGKLLDWYDKPDNQLLRFLLQYRLPQRYGVQRVGPGNAVYESIRKEVLEEEEKRIASPEYEEAILQSINQKLDLVRARRAKAAEKDAKRQAPDEDDPPAPLEQDGSGI